MATKRANPSSSTTPKRTRFASPSPTAESSKSNDNPEADDLLEEDLVQGSSRVRDRAKRQVKDTEGYGSDSSNDEEGVVPSRRAPVKGEEDEDVDMFAEDVDEAPAKGTDQGKGKGKGSEKEFMDLNDVEGQEFDRGKDREESDSEEEEGGTDKEKYRKAKEVDLGFEVTPFNMKTEMDEGRFTADGEAYQENERDSGDKHDMWLEDMDKEAIRKARKAHREREKVEREKEEREAEGGKGRDNELLREAVGLMERGETVLEALQRVGKEVEEKRKKEEMGGKKKSWAERQRERKAAMATEQEQVDPLHTSNPFTNLSNIVSALTSIGHLDVYSLSRESIQRMLPVETPKPNGASQSNGAPLTPHLPGADDRQFQYRFSIVYVRSLPESQRPIERETFGPFPVTQLKQWRGTGFFGGPTCPNVELRKPPTAGGEGSVWGSWADVVGS